MIGPRKTLQEPTRRTRLMNTKENEINFPFGRVRRLVLLPVQRRLRKYFPMSM